jgi:predicted MFS family arabinose efflux permease
MTPRAAIILQISSLGAIAASAGAPTPLYRIYAEHWGLSPVMVTTVFSVYAISLLVALLTVGGLSDYVGRRPMMVASIMICALSMAVFALADSVVMLLAARIIQGFGVGIAFGSIGAAILDTNRIHGSLMNSVTPVTSTGMGALMSGLLATYAPMPTQLIYLVLLAVMLLQAALVGWMPETAVKRPGALASMRPTIVVPAQARSALVLVSPGNISLWALCGFYMSLMPSLMRTVSGSSSLLLGGVAIAVLTFSGAAAMLAARPWPGTTILVRSMSALILGVAITLVGVHAQSIGLLISGTVIAGFGFGAGFFGGIRTVVPLALPHQRAGLLSMIFVICYLAFSLPTIAAGLAVPAIGMTLTLDLYGAAVIVLAAISLIGVLSEIRRAA